MDIESIMSAIRERHPDRGPASLIAERCGVSRQAVAQWRVVPPANMQAVAELAGKTPADLRPDLFKRVRKWGA